MKRNATIQFILFFIFISITFFACKKNKIFTAATQLKFSIDTLTFDTVFTSIGTTTSSFKIYNQEKQPIKISRIYLQKGNQSTFRINVDGVAGTHFENIEIAANDSIYVFVAATIDPNNNNSPMVIDELLNTETNGQVQTVDLRAWGQDAYFHNLELISTTTWANDKPHVLIGSCLIDSQQILTIQPGTKIYCHAYSGLFVSGQIKARGTKQDSIVFQGDRLEQFYNDLPGQWEGIYILRGGLATEMEHVIIKNANTGLLIGKSLGGSSSDFVANNAPGVILKNCVIKNCQLAAIQSLFGAVVAQNCLFYNANGNLISIALGGILNLKHCTLANYNSATISHKDPILYLSNVYAFSSSDVRVSTADINLQNCIVYGSIDKGEEINIQEYPEATAPVNYLFQNCIVSTTRSIVAPHFGNCQGSATNQLLPNFVSITAPQDFRLAAGSPAINAGMNINNISTDINEKPHAGLPDIGCFEF
jgi:hypothetical protein